MLLRVINQVFFPVNFRKKLSLTCNSPSFQLGLNHFTLDPLSGLVIANEHLGYLPWVPCCGCPTTHDPVLWTLARGSIGS